MTASKTPTSEPPEPWVISQEPSGLWRAMINLDGDFHPLGYFGSREDAEALVAAYEKPRRPKKPPSAGGVD